MYQIATQTKNLSASKSEVEALEACLERLGTGDTAALEELYRRTSASVYSYALSVLRSIQDAEDVLHDCFVNIFTTAGSYKPQGKPLAWIITVAKNLCFTKLRERKRLAPFDTDDPPDGALPFDKGDLTPDDRMMLKACMSALTPEENRIVVLHAVAGFKHREIAELMDMPLATVLSKYHRSLGKLREYLK